ncbi:MAG: hypothetical protein KatS3mg012_0025 [Gaiellaceae bacterium]|jgi:hypothetical protein|nr:MAG: hypothetical protein KatS3mg012_0025 [Gaiellaceae bacterium]
MSATVFAMRVLLAIALHPGRLLAAFAALVAGFLYLWVASVRAVPDVRRRKAAIRAAWRRRVRARA